MEGLLLIEILYDKVLILYFENDLVLYFDELVNNYDDIDDENVKDYKIEDNYLIFLDKYKFSKEDIFNMSKVLYDKNYKISKENSRTIWNCKLLSKNILEVEFDYYIRAIFYLNKPATNVEININELIIDGKNYSSGFIYNNSYLYKYPESYYTGHDCEPYIKSFKWIGDTEILINFNNNEYGIYDLKPLFEFKSTAYKKFDFLLNNIDYMHENLVVDLGNLAIGRFIDYSDDYEIYTYSEDGIYADSIKVNENGKIIN